MNKTETKLFLTILFISLVTFTFSSLRDIDFLEKILMIKWLFITSLLLKSKKMMKKLIL